MATKLALAAAAAFVLVSAQDVVALERWVRVVNQGNSAIWSVHISNVHNGVWSGPDLLGEHVIEPGYSMVVDPYNPQGYCRFDVLMTYEGGTEVPVWDVNLCEALEIIVDDFGYTRVGY